MSICNLKEDGSFQDNTCSQMNLYFFNYKNSIDFEKIANVFFEYSRRKRENKATGEVSFKCSLNR